MTSSPSSGLKGLIAPALATMVALSILVSLGIWQLQRKAWKEGLLAQIEARAFGPPGEVTPEGTWPTWRADADEFRRVKVSGTFQPDDTVAIHGLAEIRPRQALQGFYVFVPLRRDDGSTVIVNQGFVPTEQRDQALATLAAAARAPASVVGLVRAPETRGLFVPENNPSSGTWFVRSLDDIVRAKSLARVAPFYIDADATPNPGGWPRGGQTQLTLRNDHLQYALTWFGLALTLVGVFATFAVGRLRGSAEPYSPAGEASDHG